MVSGSLNTARAGGPSLSLARAPPPRAEGGQAKLDNAAAYGRNRT